MTKEETIYKLWLKSLPGTRIEDIEAAYNAGAQSRDGAITLADVLAMIETEFNRAIKVREEEGNHIRAGEALAYANIKMVVEELVGAPNNHKNMVK